MKAVLVVFFIVLAGCAVGSARDVPLAPPPKHTKWVRSSSIDEFAEEIRREEAKAVALNAEGVFLVRIYPTFDHWQGVKDSMPEIQVVWRCEPDGSDPQMIGGAGFATVDESGDVRVFHIGIGYRKTISK